MSKQRTSPKANDKVTVTDHPSPPALGSTPANNKSQVSDPIDKVPAAPRPASRHPKAAKGL
jgi:hypothetical protein